MQNAFWSSGDCTSDTWGTSKTSRCFSTFSEPTYSTTCNTQLLKYSPACGLFQIDGSSIVLRSSCLSAFKSSPLQVFVIVLKTLTSRSCSDIFCRNLYLPWRVRLVISRTSENCANIHNVIPSVWGRRRWPPRKESRSKFLRWCTYKEKDTLLLPVGPFCPRNKVDRPPSKVSLLARREWIPLLLIELERGLTLPGATMFSLPANVFWILTTWAWFSCIWSWEQH